MAEFWGVSLLTEEITYITKDDALQVQSMTCSRLLLDQPSNCLFRADFIILGQRNCAFR